MSKWAWGLIGGGTLVGIGALLFGGSKADAAAPSTPGGGGGDFGSGGGAAGSVYYEWRNPVSGQLRQMHMPTPIQRLGTTKTTHTGQTVVGFWMPNTYATGPNLVQFYLTEPALAALEQAQAAMVRAGGSILITDAFRDWDTQMHAYQTKPGIAVHPSKSNHPLGVAIDIKPGGVSQQAMETILAPFGWVRTVPHEPWHFDYKG